jgi:hypothetical protein
VLCRECLPGLRARKMLALCQLLQQRVLLSCPSLVLLRLPLGTLLAAVARRSTA